MLAPVDWQSGRSAPSRKPRNGNHRLENALFEEINLTTWDGFDGYWVPRGWSKEGPMKTQNRIDVPGGRGLVAGQPTPVAGIAWAPTRGIEQVEINIDDEGWLSCQLGEAAGGRGRLLSVAASAIDAVRARAGNGITQSPEELPPPLRCWAALAWQCRGR